MAQTKEHLRRGWYGGVGSAGQVWAECNVKGCWEKAKGEINSWIAKDAENNPEGEGLSGDLEKLSGAKEWMLQGIEKDLIEDLDEQEEEDDGDDEGGVDGNHGNV